MRQRQVPCEVGGAVEGNVCRVWSRSLAEVHGCQTRANQCMRAGSRLKAAARRAPACASSADAREEVPHMMPPADWLFCRATMNTSEQHGCQSMLGSLFVT